jgi:nitrogenase molybdenum-iron protein alpha/beta subunit
MSEKQIARTSAVFDVHVNDLPLELRKEARRRLNYRIGRMWQQLGNKKNAIVSFKDSINCTNKIYVFKTLLFGAFLIFTPRILWKKI